MKLDLADITAILAQVGVGLCDLMDEIKAAPDDQVYSKARVMHLVQAFALDTSKVMLLAAGNPEEAEKMSQEFPDLGVLEIVFNGENGLAANQRPPIKEDNAKEEDDEKLWN